MILIGFTQGRRITRPRIGDHRKATPSNISVSKHRKIQTLQPSSPVFLARRIGEFRHPKRYEFPTLKAVIFQ